MTLDPQIAAMLDQMNAMDVPSPVSLGVDGYRGMLAQSADMMPMGESEEVASVTDMRVPGIDDDIPVRVYRPVDTEERPGVLVYFHGGGFVACGLDTHDELCRSLSNRSGCCLVAVDYRLAPESPFPAPLDDCYTATRWVAGHGDRLGVDAGRLAVGGDSAGATLAAAVALKARETNNEPAIRHQLLLDPVVDSACRSDSYERFGEGYFLTREMMRWFWGHYLGAKENATNPLASPAHAENLAGLPPATVITTEYCPLRDEGEAYARRLETAGVPVVQHRYEGMIHGFLSFGALDGVDRARTDIGRWLNQGLQAE